MLIALLSVIIIHSAPFDELAQGPAAPPVLKGSKTIVPTKFQFSGNKLIPTSRLEKLIHPYLHKSVSEIELSEIEQRIELLYRTLGYRDAHATVISASDQGVVVIKIVEGQKGPTAAPDSK